MKKKNITIPLAYVLTAILIAMKLDGIIDWKWIYVIFPIWGSYLTDIMAMIIAYFIGIIINFNETQADKRKISPAKPLVWDAKTNTMYGAPEGDAEHKD